MANVHPFFTPSSMNFVKPLGPVVSGKLDRPTPHPFGTGHSPTNMPCAPVKGQHMHCRLHANPTIPQEVYRAHSFMQVTVLEQWGLQTPMPPNCASTTGVIRPQSLQKLLYPSARTQRPLPWGWGGWQSPKDLSGPTDKHVPI